MTAIRMLLLILGTAGLTFLGTQKVFEDRQAAKAASADELTFGAVESMRGAQSSELSQTRNEVIQARAAVESQGKSIADLAGKVEGLPGKDALAGIGNELDKELEATAKAINGHVDEALAAADKDTAAVLKEILARLDAQKTALEALKGDVEQAGAEARAMRAAATPGPQAAPQQHNPKRSGQFGPDRTVFLTAPWCVHCKPLQTAEARAALALKGLQMGVTEGFAIQIADIETRAGAQVVEMLGLIRGRFSLPYFVRIAGGKPVEVVEGEMTVDQLAWFATHAVQATPAKSAKVAGFRQVTD